MSPWSKKGDNAQRPKVDIKYCKDFVKGTCKTPPGQWCPHGPHHSMEKVKDMRRKAGGRSTSTNSNSSNKSNASKDSKGNKRGSSAHRRNAEKKKKEKAGKS